MTLARSEARLTEASSTPSSRRRLRSIVVTQLAQVIPVTGSVTRRARSAVVIRLASAIDLAGHRVVDLRQRRADTLVRRRRLELYGDLPGLLVDVDALDALHLSQLGLNGVNAMAARDIGNGVLTRFHVPLL